MSSLHAIIKRIRLKTTWKIWRFHYSHYKAIGYFLDIQGQIILLSVIQSGQNSNLSKMLCISSLHASLQKIGPITIEKTWRLLFKTLNCSYLCCQFSYVAKFKLIQVCFHYLQVSLGSDHKHPRKSGDIVLPL